MKRLLIEIRSLFRIYNKLRSEPLTRQSPWRGMIRFFHWQIVSRLARASIVVPFIGNTRLVSSFNMPAATGNIYFGLMEFEDMGFVLHFLQPSDRFADIGANVGSFTVLASGVCGAQTVCIEPIATTRAHLRDNLQINCIEKIVRVEACAVGAENGVVTFTADSDCTNRILISGESYAGQSVQVPLRRIDDLLGEFSPMLIKIDVEGFEYTALQHASEVLSHPECLALIVEINGSGKQYGISDKEVDSLIRAFGFIPASYDPYTRTLTELSSFGTHNTIYVKNLEHVRRRLRNGKPFTVLGTTI